MTNLAKPATINLISFKDGIQVAEINGDKYQFDFTENELADSIEASTLLNELSNRSGLHADDYSAKEMAIEIASYWEAEDVEAMIAGLPANELFEYIVKERKELNHAA
jgi:predicted lactoylglutathione lyase